MSGVRTDGCAVRYVCVLSLPADPLAADPIPVGPFPADAIPADSIPADLIPSDLIPVDPIPADPIQLIRRVLETAMRAHNSRPLPARWQVIEEGRGHQHTLPDLTSAEDAIVCVPLALKLLEWEDVPTFSVVRVLTSSGLEVRCDRPPSL